MVDEEGLTLAFLERLRRCGGITDPTMLRLLEIHAVASTELAGVTKSAAKLQHQRKASHVTPAQTGLPDCAAHLRAQDIPPDIPWMPRSHDLLTIDRDDDVYSVVTASEGSDGEDHDDDSVTREDDPPLVRDRGWTLGWEEADLQMGRREVVMRTHQMDRGNRQLGAEYTWLTQRLQ